MTDLRQAAQQALEALIDAANVLSAPMFADAITALKAALEQQAEPPPEWPLVKNILDEYGLDAISFVVKWQAAQQAEPVQERITRIAWDERGVRTVNGIPDDAPQRQWVGLTPEEILDLFDRNNVYGSKWIEFARTVEAKLKEKNDY